MYAGAGGGVVHGEFRLIGVDGSSNRLLPEIP
jgi:hypothetical protein